MFYRGTKRVDLGFSQKIKLAKAFRISYSVLRGLERLNAIHNRFAHSFYTKLDVVEVHNLFNALRKMRKKLR